MSDPCPGHDCDRCPRCEKDRCCRTDNPGYALPALGDWQPFIGEFGVLADDGDRAECHICGSYYRHLGNHIWLAHDLTAPEYRALFGLNASTGLIGPALAMIRAEDSRRLVDMAALVAAGREALDRMTPEQRSAWAAHPRRLETTSRARARGERQRQAICAECGSTFIRRLSDSTYCSPGCLHAARLKGGRPAGPTKPVVCVICGTVTERPIYSRVVTCGASCLTERRRLSIDEHRDALVSGVRRSFAERMADPETAARIRARAKAASQKAAAADHYTVPRVDVTCRRCGAPFRVTERQAMRRSVCSKECQIAERKSPEARQRSSERRLAWWAARKADSSTASPDDAMEGMA